jgi:hypothetical protein
MDIASPQPIERLNAGAEPAFHKRWNGWTVLWVFCTLVLLFVLVQTFATVAWLYLKFPDVLLAAQRGNVGPLQALLTPTGLAKVLTPMGFLAIQGPTTLIMVPATLGLARVALGANLSDLGFGQTLRGSTALKAIGAGAILFLLSIVLELFQDKIFGPHPQQVALILAKHHGVIAILLDLLSAAVLAPLFEETLFRGVLFTALVQRMQLPVAATLSGLAFGVAHLDKYNFVLLAVIGFGLAYVYYRSGNIWANIVTHATFNSLGLTLPLIFPQLNN